MKAVERIGRAAFSHDSREERLLQCTAPQQGQRVQALVHVATDPGPGRLRLLRGDTRSEVYRGRVQYNPLPFLDGDKQPPPGIKVVRWGWADSGAPESLLLLFPGARFHIERDGQPKGLPPVLDVTWTGTDLYVRPPSWWERERAKPRRRNRAA